MASSPRHLDSRPRSPAGRLPAPARALGLAATTIAALIAVPGCTPYRIEYHRRPSFYQDMSDERLPERVVLDNGTVVVYSEDRNRDWLRAQSEAPEFKLRNTTPDGTVELRALLPEHVIAHALDCVRRREYQLMWDQLLAEQTKLAYAEAGQGYEEFEKFMRVNSIPLARMLNRMNLGINMNECAMGYAAPGLYRVQFHPRVVWNQDGTRQFAFDKVDMAQESFQLKLVLIH